jgi:hypothetical protein
VGSLIQQMIGRLVQPERLADRAGYILPAGLEIVSCFVIFFEK